MQQIAGMQRDPRYCTCHCAVASIPPIVRAMIPMPHTSSINAPHLPLHHCPVLRTLSPLLSHLSLHLPVSISNPAVPPLSFIVLLQSFASSPRECAACFIVICAIPKRSSLMQRIDFANIWGRQRCSEPGKQGD